MVNASGTPYAVFNPSVSGLRLGTGITDGSVNAKLEARDTASQIAFGTAADQGFLTAQGGFSALTSGSNYNGANWVARQTNAAAIQVVNTGSIRFNIDSSSALVTGGIFTPTEIARFTPNGLSVGMTANSAAKLEVQDSTGASQIAFGAGAGQAYLRGSSANANLFYGYTYDGSNFVAKQTISGGYTINNSGTAWQHIWYGNTGLTAGTTMSPGEQMKLLATGLGIGMTPAAKLDVNGVGRFSGTTSPTSGVGIEFGHDGTNGYVTSYDRTAASYKGVIYNGSTHNFKIANVNKFTVDTWNTSATTLQVTGQNDPTTGQGIELLYAGTTGVIQAYDRGGSAWKNLSIKGNSIYLNKAGVDKLAIDGNGVSVINAVNYTVTIVTTNTLTVDTTHNRIISNPTVAGAVTITLPLAPVTGREIVIKDGKGDAATNNITISGNGKTIDGNANFVINNNYDSVTIIYNGTQWNII
jgi:hypothetical protein